MTSLEQRLLDYELVEEGFSASDHYDEPQPGDLDFEIPSAPPGNRKARKAKVKAAIQSSKKKAVKKRR